MNIMRRSRWIWLVAATSLASAGADAAPDHGYADLVFRNGKVITVDPAGHMADAVAVQHNRIVAVGSVADWIGPATKVVDLKGRTLLPGFIDSHSHVSGMANVEAHYINIQVPPLKDGAAILAKLKDVEATRPKGVWLIGQGTYNQVMPTREELDAAFPDTPVDLQWSVHDHLINHKAAVAMGMTKAFPDPPAGSTGRYERTADGEVKITRDAPVPLPETKFTYDEMKGAVRDILQHFYLERGVTTVSDMSEPDTYRAYQQLKVAGELPTRVRINYILHDPAFMDTLKRIGIHTGFGDDMMRVGAVKVIFDGVWGTTAAVYKPFWNGSGTTWLPGNRGGTAWDQATLTKVVVEAREAGWQVQIHANGDRAQDMVLNAYEAADKASPKADARDRIEHFGHFLVQDPERTQERLARMVRDHVIPSPQPAFLWRLTDTNIQEPNVKFFALRDMIALGLHPAGGIDTVGTQNFATYPMFSIARAVGRRTKYGKVVQPEEAISVMEGIKMFTIWAAEANFLEKKLGSIEVGKLADFVVLDRDPLSTPADDLASIPVDMTVLDGKIAYERH
jgi:predicted amidohydrolase YtcJ